MNILDTLKQLRDDIKTWVTNNLNALNTKIDEKTVPIDSELSSTSTNPVQNKVIKKAIDNIPKFSGDYNDLTNAPDISEDDSGEVVVADESGNIIFKADADGIHTTAVSLNGEAAATEKYVDEAVASIDIPEVDFTGYATEDFVTTTVDSAKEELSESIVAESDEWKVVDEAGNIIFSVDAEGAHTINLTLDGKKAATEEYVNETVAGIDIPEVDFTGYATEDYVDTAIQEAQLASKEVDLSNYYTKQETEALIPDTSSFLTAVPADYVTESELDDKGFLTEHQSLEGLATSSEVEAHTTDVTIHVSAADRQKWNAKSNFSGDYNDLENAPNIAEDDSGDLVIADANGNVIFRSNGSGFETVNLIVQNLTINGMTIQEMIKAYVDEVLKSDNNE